MTQEPLDGWKPELRRAMMRVRPEYFSWPQEQQERYGVAVPEEDRERLDLVLMQELFGRTKASVEQTESISDRLSGEELNLWNETVLPLMGIGEDCFFLNEHFREGDSILQYQTLRERLWGYAQQSTIKHDRPFGRSEAQAFSCLQCDGQRYVPNIVHMQVRIGLAAEPGPVHPCWERC